jgi:hypothetical protein
MSTVGKIIVGSAIVVALAAGMLGGYWLYPALSLDRSGNDACPVSGQGGDDSSCEQYWRGFFGDQIVLMGTDADGRDFFLILELNRKQLDEHEFIHYYTADLAQAGEQAHAAVNVRSAESALVEHGFVQQATRTPATDLSTRESYALVVMIEGKRFEIHIDDLSGDFITRTMPEYTRYTSAGTAAVSLEGETFSTQVMVSTIYSSDYEHYIFFDGFDQIRSATEYLVLWDEEGFFYLIDSTYTQTVDPRYPSHTWVLSKDREGRMRKAFEADVMYTEEGQGQWEIAVSDLGIERIILQAEHLFATDNSRGTAHGSISDEDGTRQIEGYFHHLTIDD